MRKVIFPLVAAALLASCTIATGNQNNPTAPSVFDIGSFQAAYMTSYYAERGGAPSGTAGGPRALTPFSDRKLGPISRATVPVDQYGSLAFSTSATTIANYPEPGQTSTFAATPYSSQGIYPVYDVKVLTNFASTDVRKTYLEEYYVEDADGDSAWTIADPIVKFASPNWVQDQSARVQMLLTFRDGTNRNETIVATSLSSGGRLLDPTAFAVTGSLDMAQAFVPNTTAGGQGVQFSSVVLYTVTPSTSYNFWFWSGNSSQKILGIRYYTEVLSGSAYTTHTVSFEKVIGNLATTGGSYSTSLATAFVGSQFDTLAESVLRQQIVYALRTDKPTLPNLSTGQVTTNMKTRVVNIAGKKDFYISQLNQDAASLSSWDSSTIYIPTGDVAEILNGDASAGVFTRTQQTTPATGTLPLTSSTAGVGDLATVYTSISLGSAAALPAVSAPASNLASPSVGVFSFNGQQSSGLGVTGPELPNTGTVEAWVYINVMTDTAGIVHKGKAVDFSDECYSLQGWGASGQVAIVLDKPSSTSYDLVTSTINLNTKKWYYIVATWDTTPKKINLYINGVLNNSGTMSQTSAGVKTTGALNDVLIGSQLPTIYSTAYGYFGLNGKIVGANASATVMSAAQVLANYNTYVGNTSGW